MSMPSITRGMLINIAASSIFALTIFFTPWADIKGGGFEDIDNYLSRIMYISNYGFYGLSYFEFGDQWIDYVKAEYIWFLILYVIATSDIDPTIGLGLVTIFSAFVYHRHLSGKVGNIIATLLLLNPISIDLFNGQLRSAFAFSIFLLAVMNTARPIIRYPIFISTLFIHSSMGAIVALYVLSNYISSFRKLNSFQKVEFATIIGFALAFVFAVGLPSLLSAVEDRRADYTAASKGLAYLVFWFLWAAFLILFYNKKAASDLFYIFSIIICTSIPLTEILHFQAFRFIAMSMSIIIASATLTGKFNSTISLTVLGMYQVLQFNYWIE